MAPRGEFVEVMLVLRADPGYFRERDVWEEFDAPRPC
jgi:hypothetical protein